MAGEVGFALRPGGGPVRACGAPGDGFAVKRHGGESRSHSALAARRCSSSPMSPTTYHPITGMVGRLDALLG